MPNVLNSYKKRRRVFQSFRTKPKKIICKKGYFYENILISVNLKLFTYLEDFKLKGAHASPYMILTIFDELLIKKGLYFLF